MQPDYNSMNGEMSVRIQPPHDPQLKRTRSIANYVGWTVLSVAISRKLTFSVLAYLLCAVGVFDARQLQQPFLGLDNTTYLLFYLLVYLLAMAVPAIVVALCYRRRFFPLSPASPCAGGIAFFSVPASVGVCLLSSMVVNVILTALSRYGVTIPENPSLMDGTPTSLALGLVVMAVAPALVEEMVYRGYILRVLRANGDWFAVVVSAALFGLMHGNLRQVPFAFAVGLLLGWLYVTTNNIWLPVTVHFANNAVAVLLEYFGFHLTDMALGVCSGFAILLLIGYGIVALIVLCVRYPGLFRLQKRKPGRYAEFPLLGFVTAPVFLISLAVLIVVMIMELK